MRHDRLRGCPSSVWRSSTRTKEQAIRYHLTREASRVSGRFETCYDCLEGPETLSDRKLGLVDIPNSPKPIFRLADENNLFASSLEQWLQYADARIGTSHDYRGSLPHAGPTSSNAIGLYQTMSETTKP